MRYACIWHFLVCRISCKRWKISTQKSLSRFNTKNDAFYFIILTKMILQKFDIVGLRGGTCLLFLFVRLFLIVMGLAKFAYLPIPILNGPLNFHQFYTLPPQFPKWSVNLFNFRKLGTLFPHRFFFFKFFLGLFCIWNT